jgi:hypothetical protein
MSWVTATIVTGMLHGVPILVSMLRQCGGRCCKCLAGYIPFLFQYKTWGYSMLTRFLYTWRIELNNRLWRRSVALWLSLRSLLQVSRLYSRATLRLLYLSESALHPMPLSPKVPKIHSFRPQSHYLNKNFCWNTKKSAKCKVTFRGVGSSQIRHPRWNFFFWLQTYNI